MAELQKGFTIKTINFKTVKVDMKLGEGGQGAVYKVDFDGQPKALKWYTGTKIASPKKFYENLLNNVKKGAPTEAFLWPEDITEKQGEAFGYIMKLRPPEYEDFTLFLNGKQGFASITAMVNAALKITAGFRALHLKGYSYQDLNDGNFFINPKNGDVLICDNDNVSEHGKTSGIAGKARYMAPEIVTGGGKAQPNDKTDRFSLSVVLFLLFVNAHPLEGKNAYPSAMVPKYEKMIYGENPVFIFDPSDNSNAPIPSLNKGAIARWPFLPKYAQDVFIKAFSKQVMKDPSYRLLEREWIQLFIRMRGEIFKCDCGASSVYFADPANPNSCPFCKKKNVFPAYIKTPLYNVPLHQRTRLYACHTEKDSEDFTTLTGECSAKGSEYEIKNVSGKKWFVTEGNNRVAVDPNGSIVIKKGQAFDFSGGTAEII
jgi:DNA-binding helix-hairpin-helix protein with protein kinase domain